MRVELESGKGINNEGSHIQLVFKCSTHLDMKWSAHKIEKVVRMSMY